MKENPQSKFPEYHRPMVVRMHMANKDNQVRFSQRFHSEYMGRSEFEGVDFSKRLREMHQEMRVGCVSVDGCDTYIAYSPKYFANHEEVEAYLSDIYHERLRAFEFTRFNREYRRETIELKKEYGKKENKLKTMPTRTNAWFDIEVGLFWTMEKININDLRLNIRKSVEYMDQQKAAQS